jgi:hypothetical protein
MPAVALPPLGSLFGARSRRARRWSAVLSLGIHLGVLAIFACSAVAQFWRLAEGATSAALFVAGDAAPPGPPIELVEPPPPPAPPTPGAPAGLDPETWRAKMRLGAQERSRGDPQEMLGELESLLGPAAEISDQSLEELGQFFGAKPGTYKPRAYYQDELNPNANLATAEFVRAFRFQDAGGQAGYTMTLQDAKRDEQTFSLSGKSAVMLESGGLAFEGKKIGGEGAELFELKGARVADVRRWTESRESGATLILRSAAGAEREVRVAGREAELWLREQMRFAKKSDGSYVNDPDDDTTMFMDAIDHASLSIWRATEAPEKEPGVKRARVEMIDAKGERMIFYMEGPEAEDVIRRVGILDKNPVVRNLYEKTGMAGILRQMMDGQEQKKKPAAPKTPAPAAPPAPPQAPAPAPAPKAPPAAPAPVPKAAPSGPPPPVPVPAPGPGESAE